MTNPPELRELERESYGESYSDGVIDIFVGISTAWLGAMWLTWPGYLPGAAALVAVSISPMMARRKRFVEARTGYVKFTEQRRRRERAVYTTAGFLFAGLMLVARPLGSLQSDDLDWAVGPDSLIAWLLALVAVAIGIIVVAKRTFAYAAVLIATGAIAAMVEAQLGWPLLVSGVVIFLTGLVMTRRFLDRHPRTETS